MQKRDKFYILVCILSFASMVISVILKLIGIDIFKLNNYNSSIFLEFDIYIGFIILVIQYILIVGCAIRLPFKELCIKMIPFVPLNLMLYFLPKDLNYSKISILILFVTTLSLSFKFSTIINFILNIIVISILQLTIIWLRLDIKAVFPVFPTVIQLLIMNIDQFIILSALYYVNRKWGGKYGLDFLRRKKEKIIS